MEQTKTCNKCGKQFPATSEYFGRHKECNDGLRPTCKACIAKYYQDNKERIENRRRSYNKENKERVKIARNSYYEANKRHSREYYKNNKERIAAVNKIYMQEHPGRRLELKKKYIAAKKKMPNTLTKKQWDDIKQVFNNRCAYCGRELPLTKEHFVPLSKMGELSKNNIICACASCNSSKHKRDFFEWYPTYEYYSKSREKKILDFLNYKNGVQQLTMIG